MLGHPGRHFRIVVVAERLRPHRPAPGILALGIEVGLQGIEGGLLLQAVAAGGDERIEGGLTLGAEARLIEHLTQHAELGLDDAGVIHVALGTQLAQMLLEGGTCHFRLETCVPLEFGHGLHIDVGHVEPAPGRGAVRAGALRVGRIEGMDRVEADEVGAPGGHLLDQLTQIAEIADAPVVAAAQAVELHARAPHLAAIGDGRLLVARLGRDDEAHAGERLVVALLQQDQIVITQLGLHIQGHAIGLALHLFEFGHADQLTVDGGELTGQQAALLQLELPGEGVVDEFDGQTDFEGNGLAAADHHHGIQRTQPVLAVLLLKLLGQGGLVVDAVTHGAQHGGLALFGYQGRLAPGINILAGNAFGGSQLFNQGGHSLRIPAVDSIYTILINFYGWYLNSGSMGHAKPRTFLHICLAGCVTE